MVTELHYKNSKELWWGLGEKNERIKQRKKPIDAYNSMVITRGERMWGEVEEGEGRIHGDGWRPDLG